MDVLLLAMECNDAAANTYHRGSIGYAVPAQVEDHQQICVLIDGSEYSSSASSNPPISDFQHSSFTRKSCHRCGNIRKNCRKCPSCPHIICKNCVLKMTAMYDHNGFNATSCPVCAFLCCCNSKSAQCTNKYHCYRKCPVSRSNRKRQPQKSFTRYCHLTSNQNLKESVATASLALDSDADTASALEGFQQGREDESEGGQDDPDTELEDMPSLVSPSRSLPPFSPLSDKGIIKIKTKGGTIHDLKLPGFLSYGLLLGGEVHSTRSNAFPSSSFASRGALISCDDKMPGDPFFYSV